MSCAESLKSQRRPVGIQDVVACADDAAQRAATEVDDDHYTPYNVQRDDIAFISYVLLVHCYGFNQRRVTHDQHVTSPANSIDRSMAEHF